MTEKEIWHGENADLNLVTDKNRRDKNGDMKGKPLRYEVRSRIMNLLEQKVEGKDGKMRNMKHDEIAKMMGVCKKTISNYKRATKNQNLEKIHDPELGVLTVGVPAPGKQGGFRWARMNEEQQEMCVQLATEYPRDTVAQLKLKLQEKYPELNVSDSTVWRTLKTANISFVRAKMKDPLGEGDLASKAKQDELKDFILEQDKDNGMLNPLNLFFMDETLVTLNEVSRRGWGSKESIPEFAKSKGKTLTLNLYVGLGLVSNSYDSSNDEFRNNNLDPGCKITDLTPRGNHLNYDEQTQCWSRAKDPPKFALFWWIRPPTREGTALSRFLNVDDILDPNFRLFDPTKLDPTKQNICGGPDLTTWKKSVSMKKGRITVPKKNKPFHDMFEAKVANASDKDTITLSQEELKSFDKLTSKSYIKLTDGSLYFVESATSNTDEDTELDCGFFKPALTVEKTVFSKKISKISLDSDKNPKVLKVEYEDDTFVNVEEIAVDEKKIKIEAYLDDSFEWTTKWSEYSADSFFKFEDFIFKNSVKLHEKHNTLLNNFLDYSPDGANVAQMRKLMWLNGIEYRQVDKEDGSLIKVNLSENKNNKKQNPVYINSSLEDMIYYFKELQILVKNALGIDRSKPLSKIIPRSYYSPTGRNTLGGKVDSERGDRALFLKYLVETVNYYTSSFPDEVLDNLRLAWDSAPQHGKIDVDSNHYSYIHNWCKDFLNVSAIFLPVKAPDYNPAENLIGYIKGQIRLKQRSFTGEATVAKMVELIDSAMNKVTESMVKGWVRYGCYKIPGDNTPLDPTRCVNKLLELKPAANYLDISLNLWKQDLFSKYPNLKDEDIFENGEFKPDILEIIKYSYDYGKLKNMLKKYNTIQDVLDDISFGEIIHASKSSELDATDTIILSGNVFNLNVDAKYIHNFEIDDKSGVIYLTRKDGKKFKYFVTIVQNTTEPVIILNDGFTLPDDAEFTNNTVIQYKEIKFTNKCEIHISNFKVPEYKELLNLTSQCKEEANFPCIAKFLKAKIMSEGDSKESTAKLAQFLDYISEYISESRGPLYYLKSCQRFVDSVIDQIYDDDSVNLTIEDKINILLDGFLPHFKKGDTISIEDSKVIHNGKEINLTFLPDSSNQTITDMVRKIIKVRETYIEVEGKYKFTSTNSKRTSTFLMQVTDEKSESLKAEAKNKITKLIEKTPYKSSIPSIKENDDFYILGICIVVMKAILHERDILKDINNTLGHAIQAEIDDTDEINWLKILKISNESVLKLKRKCEKCEKSKFKRFPVFDVFSLREKHITHSDMKDKALYKKKKDERRWPGYPKLTDEELNEKYEERGTGPEFNVTVVDGKKRLNNILESIVVHPKNENIVTIIDNGVQKIVTKDDKEWEYYFGPFSKENQLKLQLARQRMKENNEKMIKMENKSTDDSLLKTIQTGKSVDLIMPDGTTVVLKDPISVNDNNAIFYDYESKRIYPPTVESYEIAKNKVYKLIFIPSLKDFKDFNTLKNIIPKCLIAENIKFGDEQIFGFKSNMYTPFPRKKLGIDLNFKNLSKNKDVSSELYYVTLEDYEVLNTDLTRNTEEIFPLTKHPNLELIIVQDKSPDLIPILKNKDNNKEYVLIMKDKFKSQHNKMKLDDKNKENKKYMKKGFDITEDESETIKKIIENIDINTRI